MVNQASSIPTLALGLIIAVTYFLLRQHKLKNNTIYRLFHSVFTMKPAYDAFPYRDRSIETHNRYIEVIKPRPTHPARKATSTTKNLYHLNKPFVSDSLGIQRAYRTAIFRAMCKVDGSAWGRIGDTVGKALEPLLSKEMKLCEDGKGVRSVTGNLKQISLNASLAAILKALFDIDDFDTQTLSYISNSIHNMAVRAKRHTATSSNPSSIPPALQHDADHLISTLQTLFKEKKSRYRPCEENSLRGQWDQREF
ncbi:uncharacterized protein BDV14DRAFT_197718 [Aspergillus stella-maris]|uniref:uncharacterized protein n=1 Tax=Aspergillus stella-maris TaxID=1810926 RepID=UPI003CCD0A1F